MTQWYVQLVSTDNTLLDFLTTCMHEQTCTIIKEDGKYFWLSSDFDSFTTDVQAREYAKEQLPLLNSIVRLKFHQDISWIHIDNVYRRDSNGQLVSDWALFGDWVGHFYPNESTLQATNAQMPSVIDIWLMVQKNDLVKEALNNYAPVLNWVKLRKIYEIITEDVKKATLSGKLPPNTLNDWLRGWGYDFEQTASAYRYNKDAVHSSVIVTKRKPATSMSFSKAIEHITNLLMKWLQTNP